MGGKVSWFDAHRQFLPMDHSFRRNKGAFYKNRIENSQPPYFLTGNELWEQICFFFSKVTELVLVCVMDMVSLIIGQNKVFFGSCLIGVL